jgi:hypothetical protein
VEASHSAGTGHPMLVSNSLCASVRFCLSAILRPCNFGDGKAQKALRRSGIDVQRYPESDRTTRDHRHGDGFQLLGRKYCFCEYNSSNHGFESSCATYKLIYACAGLLCLPAEHDLCKARYNALGEEPGAGQSL